MRRPPSLHLYLSPSKVSRTHFQSRKTEAREGSVTCSKSPSWQRHSQDSKCVQECPAPKATGWCPSHAASGETRTALG